MLNPRPTTALRVACAVLLLTGTRSVLVNVASASPANPVEEIVFRPHPAGVAPVAAYALGVAGAALGGLAVAYLLGHQQGTYEEQLNQVHKQQTGQITNPTGISLAAGMEYILD